MSWLLFLDESGHDHKSMPYEVRGGIALQDMEVWPFVQEMQRLELASFGVVLHQFRTELKGCKLLDRDRFKWASQGPPLRAPIAELFPEDANRPIPFRLDCTSAVLRFVGYDISSPSRRSGYLLPELGLPFADTRDERGNPH